MSAARDARRRAQGNKPTDKTVPEHWDDNRFVRRTSRGAEETLYAITSPGAATTMLWAETPGNAFDAFVALQFPVGEGGGRLKPPARDEVVVRPARTDEVVFAGKRGGGRSKLRELRDTAVAAGSALFDADRFGPQARRTGSGTRQPSETGNTVRGATEPSKRLGTPSRPVAPPGPDPALEQALRTATAAPGPFDGGTFDAEADGARLTGQLRRVHDCLADGQWWTLRDLARKAGGAEASVSARIRDLRKEKFGGFTVLHRRHPDAAKDSGIWQYRLMGDEL